MLPERVYTKEFFSFISENINSDPSELLMKYAGKNLDFDLNLAVIQIANRKKTKKKLPFFLSNENFVFPDLISSEQATDERVARFHASLIGTGKNVVDLTAGLGIDAMCVAMSGNRVTAIEIDPMKAFSLRGNAIAMNIPDFRVINDSCENFLKECRLSDYDVFFIDPARRNELKRRTYAFSDCTPDITSFYEVIIEQGTTLMIKASPLLEIRAVIKQFKYIEHIYAISVKGECKELLIVLRKSENKTPALTAIDLDNNSIKSSFAFHEDTSKLEATIADLNDIKEGCFLYEPNASLMKLNAGGEICRKFPGMQKVSKNTELFVSVQLYSDFPGRIIKITKLLSSRDLKALKGRCYSVAVRNYPLKAEQLKKKIGVGESRDLFIYGFRSGISEKPTLIEGKKIEA